ncbi:MAG: protease modulator HflC [Alphaproteobacteria bacterium]|uniref:protease modulator HflC n=1 Tax=Pseudorhizobium pelagicum TaxID=1509405 RepID=UPI0005697CBD|nr:protease modulator HflC [Pseudorhizobium pelagicum]MBA4785144.1 protease modulator HflC [Hyphomicrobiales bacterium]MBU1315263.1 protease modulator HflC [Alphaproteobacteria bacterium]MDY6960394.1 protease modulator HflC [Pseudomonadota bacterium]MBU1550594.1 protease modulator HflC [Alphaproteobacteria bacterium]MBU2338730.1 protease modulator HflC [Alphaproteobacteria bacterium]
MSSRLPAILIGIAVVLFLIYSSVFVVNEREQAVVVRFGEIQDVKSEPGLYFKLPFAFMDADRVQYVEDRALRFDLNDIRVQVRGGAFYEVDAFVVYEISNPRLFRQTVSGDREAAESRLRTRLDAALRRVYGLRDFSAALSEERSQMMQEVGEQLRDAGESLGITVRDVRISRTDLTQEVSQQTFERMKAERLAEAELIRARGNELGQTRRAVADRQVVEIVSAAQRDSEIIRGEGDAERTQIFGEAFGRDPEFFDFYRSMTAYVESLVDTGTTLVLSPDSAFFKFLNNPDVEAGSAATRARNAAPAPAGALPAAPPPATPEASVPATPAAPGTGG